MAIALITFDRDDEGRQLTNEQFIAELMAEPGVSDVQSYKYADPEGRHASPPFRAERHKKLAGIDESE
jgi:hypothetical protein